jgi:hypothetical protein
LDDRDRSGRAQAVGRMLDERTVTGANDGLVAWASSLSNERLWALEDCRQLTRALEHELLAAGEESKGASWARDYACWVRTTPLVSPPVALTIDVFARILAELGRADDEDLEALRPGPVASPRAGRNAHRVPLLELDGLVVELHPPAPAHDDVHLLLLQVRVTVRKALMLLSVNAT